MTDLKEAAEDALINYLLLVIREACAELEDGSDASAHLILKTCLRSYQPTHDDDDADADAAT